MTKTAIVKRSIVVRGHKTSVSIEDAFWSILKEITRSRDMTLSDLVSEIDSQRSHGNLSSHIRLFVLEWARAPRQASAANVMAPPAGESGDTNLC